MRSVDRVREYFAQHHLPIEVKELAYSTRTAQLAADTVGTSLGSIVKSLVFITSDDRTILALVAGDQRGDAEKIAQCVGAVSARMANGEEVRAHVVCDWWRAAGRASCAAGNARRSNVVAI